MTKDVLISVIFLLQHVKLAKLFETYVKNDARFELLGDVKMGLVCFRLKVFKSGLHFTISEFEHSNMFTTMNTSLFCKNNAHM